MEVCVEAAQVGVPAGDALCGGSGALVKGVEIHELASSTDGCQVVAVAVAVECPLQTSGWVGLGHFAGHAVGLECFADGPSPSFAPSFTCFFEELPGHHGRDNGDTTAVDADLAAL